MASSKNKLVWFGDRAGTPVGTVWVGLSSDGLAAIDFPSDQEAFTLRLQRMGFTEIVYDPVRTGPVLDQIDEYLRGQRRGFDLPIDWSLMTPFQEQVLRLTYAIPYGSRTTYAELARLAGRPRAPRAVGRAQATNPLPLVIPCHRLLGSDGKLHGYGAGEGLATKQWLLDLEQRTSQSSPSRAPGG